MQAEALRTAKIKVIGIIFMNAPALLSSGVSSSVLNVRVSIS